MLLERISRVLALLIVTGGLLAGCPSGELTPSNNAGAAIVPGVYIGTVQVVTTHVSGPEGISVEIADDGTVRVDGARYNLGDTITDTFVDGTTLVRVVGDVVRTSDSTLIRYSEEWERPSGSAYAGSGSMLLTRIDERTIHFEDMGRIFEVNPPDGLQRIQLPFESSGVLTR